MPIYTFVFQNLDKIRKRNENVLKENILIFSIKKKVLTKKLFHLNQ